MPRNRCECKLKDLCSGFVGYACDHLCDIMRTPYEEAVDILLDHIYETIQIIEEKTGCEIEFFYIGKTYVRARNIEFFDHMNPATWTKRGISDRFRAHRRKRYGRDGFVVLTVVTEEAIDHWCKSGFRLEEYVLALERRLIKECSLIEEECMTDSRLWNKTTKPGRRDKNKSCGYALYMAFKLED